jgi:hypothetical protein
MTILVKYITMAASNSCPLFEHSTIYSYPYGVQPRSNYSVCSDDSEIYLLGGTTSVDGDIQTYLPCPMSQVVHFNLNTSPQLLDVASSSVPLPREGHIAVILPQPGASLMLTFGGQVISEGSGKLIQYTNTITLARINDNIHKDVKNRTIKYLDDHKIGQPHPPPRCFHSACVVGDKVAICGGELADGSLTDEVWLLHLNES